MGSWIFDSDPPNIFHNSHINTLLTHTLAHCLYISQNSHISHDSHINTLLTHTLAHCLYISQDSHINTFTTQTPLLPFYFFFPSLFPYPFQTLALSRSHLLTMQGKQPRKRVDLARFFFFFFSVAQLQPCKRRIESLNPAELIGPHESYGPRDKVYV